MAERLNAPVLKTGVALVVTAGSNPAPTAFKFFLVNVSPRVCRHLRSSAMRAQVSAFQSTRSRRNRIRSALGRQAERQDRIGLIGGGIVGAVGLCSLRSEREYRVTYRWRTFRFF